MNDIDILQIKRKQSNIKLNKQIKISKPKNNTESSRDASQNKFHTTQIKEEVKNNKSWIVKSTDGQCLNKDGGKVQCFCGDCISKTKKISKKNINLLNPTVTRSKKYSTNNENKWIISNESVKTFDNRGEQSTSPHLIRIDGNKNVITL